MAKLSKFKLNRRTLQEYLDGKYGVDRLLDGEAQKVLGKARASAPVASGAYRAGLHVETAHPYDRMTKRVASDVPYALALEARTGNLARALR